MTIDGIPETLPPVTETAERSGFTATELRPVPVRRRTTPVSLEDESELIDDDAEESHVLDDLV